MIQYMKNNFLSMLFILLGAISGLFLYAAIGNPLAVRSVTTNPVSCVMLMSLTGYLVSLSVDRKEEMV